MAIELYFDGGCEGNGTPEARAFYGWIARQGGQVLARGAGRVAPDLPQTNNVGEYAALLAGLTRLAELRAAGQALDAVTVLGDSQLVINQVRGVWQVGSEHLTPLCAQARALAGEVGVTAFQWIRREKNLEADALARAAGAAA